MRKIFLYLLMPAFTVLAVKGCAKDPDTGDRSDDTRITLTLKLPAGTNATRAISETPGEENQIDNIVILALTQKGSGWVYDYTAENITWSKTNNALTATATVRDKSSPQQFVILLNAKDELEAVDPQRFQDIVDIEQNLICNAGGGEWPARNNGTGPFKPIPMYARTGAVTVSSTGGTIGNYNLLRMVARINVTLHSDIDISDFKLAEACLFNYKKAGYISYGFSGINAAGDAVSAAAVPPAPIGDHTGDPILGPNEFYEADYTDDPRGEVKHHIYTFESPAITSDAGRLRGTALVVGGYYNGNTTDMSYYRIDMKTNDDASANISSPILRNHSYNVEIRSVDGEGYNTPEDAYKGHNRIKVEITDWDLGGEVIIEPEGNHYIWLSELELSSSHLGETLELTIQTDAKGWTAIASDSDTNPAAGLAGNWFTVTPAAGTGSGTHQLTITTTLNASSVPRTGYIHINADGRVNAVVAVNQKMNMTHYTPSLSYAYVGAFWRADQTGERLIRIHRSMNGNAINGEWTAKVVEGAGWIKLDKNPSSDGSVGSSSAADMIANDHLYQVSGNAKSVSGNAGTTEDIYFRIGLKSKIGEKENRYGMILLTYNDNTKSHLIFVRQGHEADYVMRPEDSNGDGTITTQWDGTAARPRPEAKKFSPYNLTAEGYRTGSVSANSINLTYQGGVFADYPSQAGAFFRWAETGNTPIAYHPTMNAAMGSAPNTGHWYDIMGNHETCPPGYRRPNDGSTKAYNTTGPIAESEQRQSLYLNPITNTTTQSLSQVGNMLWGYLADGYFDRRSITSSGNNAVYSTVIPNSTQVAYIGMLIYNPGNFANLFIPASGNRNTSNGALSNAGSRGHCWSSSSNNSSNAWYHYLDQSIINQRGSVRGHGLTVRCVRD